MHPLKRIYLCHLTLRACFEALNGNTDMWIQFLKYVNVSTHIYTLH